MNAKLNLYIVFNLFISLVGITRESEVPAAYLRIHRSRLVSDGFEQLNNISSNTLKVPLT